jgi:hypothetical protein
MNNRSLTASLRWAIVFWVGISITIYFIAHKPLALLVLDQLGSTLWSVFVTALLCANAFSLGRLTLRKIHPVFSSAPESILIAGGIGLGELGIVGFGLAYVGIAQLYALLAIQIILLIGLTWLGETNECLYQIRAFVTKSVDLSLSAPKWMKVAAGTALTLTFLRTFLPPFEAFDALLYHLRAPELWIRDAGIQAYDVPHYWFPGLVEGVYFWALGLNAEIASQQIHFLWGVLSILLVWQWAYKLWGVDTAWWAITILASMPSLLLLSSWAYTDMALSFYGLALLFCLQEGYSKQDPRLWVIGAIAAGMSMGVKYTSVVMLISAVVTIAYWKRRNITEAMRAIAQFSLVSLITGAIWYLRNWVWMGNPFYPFVFGGKYWDSFRAAAFSGAGTGSGWDIMALLSLPITITLGSQDINQFDGNIGPLFLACLPLALIVFYRAAQASASQRAALECIGLYGLFGLSFWILGYVSTKSLWQARLLLPALIPFAIPSAVGLATLDKFDAKSLRVSFIVTMLIAAMLAVNLFDMTLGTIARNPLGILTGIVSKDNYFERYQPGYFHALKLIEQTPTDASIYSLFEPRSYGAQRKIQPDPILDNFSHDLYLYKSPGGILAAWLKQGYTHVLVYTAGSELAIGNNPDEVQLEKTLQLMRIVAESPHGDYVLYQIPEGE